MIVEIIHSFGRSQIKTFKLAESGLLKSAFLNRDALFFIFHGFGDIPLAERSKVKVRAMEILKKFDVS